MTARRTPVDVAAELRNAYWRRGMLAPPARGLSLGDECKVCWHGEKITLSDPLWPLSNWPILAKVYKSVILSTMDAQNSGKLNRLLAELGDTRLVSSRWLRAHGYSNSLVASSLLALTGWGFRASLFANPALFAVLFAGSVAVFRKAVRHYAAQRDALPQ